MKIKYVNGDLFGTGVEHIMHGCNAQGVMGSGVARIVRDDFTEAYDAYRAWYAEENKLTLGTVQFVPAQGKVIVNAITQDKFGGSAGMPYVDYDAVRQAMRTVNTVLSRKGVDEVAMPKIGAGLAGGDWAVIEEIIEAELVDVQPYVYVI